MHFCLINRWKAKIPADPPAFLELTDHPWTGLAASNAYPHKTDNRPCIASTRVWLFRYAAKSQATAHRHPLGHTPTGSFFRKSQCRPIIIRYLWSGSGTVAYPCGFSLALLPPKQRAVQSSRIARVTAMRRTILPHPHRGHKTGTVPLLWGSGWNVPGTPPGSSEISADCVAPVMSIWNHIHFPIQIDSGKPRRSRGSWRRVCAAL